RPPLPRSSQLKVLEADLYNLLAADPRGSVLREQSHGPGLDLTVFENLDRFAPSFLLSRIDLPQIQDMPLNDLSGRHAFVLDDGKIFVLFAILLSEGRTQKHGFKLYKISRRR